MDKQKLIVMGWTYLQGKTLEAASKLLNFDMGYDDSFAKKFGRKTVFLRYTDSYRFYIPFDRDDPKRLDSRWGFKISKKVWIPPGHEQDVDKIAWDLVQEFHDLEEI